MNTTGEFNGSCDRCDENRPDATYIMSMFNLDWLCDRCKQKECEHPDYEKAREAEASAVRSGFQNFKGIGKPADL